MKTLSIILAAFVASTAAHIRMSYPPAINGLENKYGLQSDEIRVPLAANEFPCKGYHKLFQDGHEAATPVVDWAGGSLQKFNIMGIIDGEFQATHGGGSCQVSFSIDGGETFRVVKSYIGNCPALNDNGNIDAAGDAQGTPIYNGFPFTVPKDLPEGPVLLGWSWFNHKGNREMYMNCAVINIVGDIGQDAVKFEDRPEIFKANIGGTSYECTTAEGTDVNFPQPGPDVVISSEAILAEPVGNCGEIKRTATPVTMAPSQILTMGLAVESGGSNGAIGASAGSVSIPSSVPGVGGADGAALEVSDSETTSVQATSTTQTVASPAATDTASTGSTSSSTSGGAGQMTPGTPCTEEGVWNCIDGKSYQRCASGQWSVVQSVAAGTACKVGQSATLFKREVRFSNAHVRRHADLHRG